MIEKNNKLSDEELIEYARIHIKYEFDMLLASASICESNVPSNTLIGFPIHNSMLESFSIHSRNLIDFFYPSEKITKSNTDISIIDYIDEKNLGKLPQISELLRIARIKANKQVAHLTTDRMTKYITDEEKGWDFKQISIEISKLFNKMARYFDKSKVSVEFLDLIKSRWHIYLFSVNQTPGAGIIIAPMSQEDYKKKFGKNIE